MGEVLELAERAWAGELDGTQVHPGRALVGFEELADGLGFMSAFSNVAALATDEGLVFVDTSSFFHAAELHREVRRWSSSRVHTAVYTHGHVDHVFGLGPFEEEARQQGHAPSHVIARQFNFPKPVFPKEFRWPDQVVRDEHVFRVGDVPVHLRHDKGETDDGLWAWLPEQRALYTGDLFIWASPNCGNPQKVQRYPIEWAAALRKMRACQAELLLPGHGPPILGADRVSQALDESARLLETICEQTLGLMNQGARLDEVIDGVRLPDALLARPYLRPTYDDPRFIVRNLWRLYGGWYDGNPAHLLPAREADLARALAELAGGPASLARAAEQQAAAGALDVACHLVELATAAAPENAAIHEVRAAVYQQRMRSELSLMSRGIYGAAARESEEKAEPS
jgi:alkyl sulfatase BDS1-like metallo-beta-lactamase superfamily hydrolase